MQGSVKIEIQLFGAFRKFSSKNPMILHVPAGMNISEIRKKIRLELEQLNPGFNQNDLINESALADEEEVLAEDFVVSKETSLALLPPVCGG